MVSCESVITQHSARRSIARRFGHQGWLGQWGSLTEVLRGQSGTQELSEHVFPTPVSAFHSSQAKIARHRLTESSHSVNHHLS